MEIERKFKVKRLPSELSGFICNHIEQGYLYNTYPVIRIRQKNDEYLLTYKSAIEPDKSISICEEIELPLTKEAYFHLRDKIDNNIITKKRFLIPLDNDLTAELDIFEGRLAGLYFVEVEFSSEEEAKNFIPPDWFGDDISSQEKFRNSSLSTIENFSVLQNM